ncbi:prepilin-type N-terminal cleavage/methylation domain-containing protein [Halomonas sp. NO4]|uniref:type IV pilus modification PilV family protein n=1 Tax=Halomonas sp. NO4 TaxID=2484813 RepID=UPI0013D7F9EA|nr:prepilin-type N-terminal cleavage/methylation domain-containing protein [Halomonas sp. NO4]
MKTKQQSGFTLIEALVALVVLSIGLLGVAAMQIKSLQSAHAGYQRSVATLAAIDAQERTWAKLAELNGCPSGSDISALSSDWVEQWFGDGKIMSDAGNSQVSEEKDCEYKATVNWEENRLEAGDGRFEYLYRLPDISG